MTTPPAVLVVDDNADVCSLYATLLRAKGYAVDTCRDADDALAHVNATRYDAVIVEPSPVAGLSPLLHQLRTEHKLGTVIAATTEDDPQFCSELARRGVFRILHKPLSRAQLTSAVDECVQTHEV